MSDSKVLLVDDEPGFLLPVLKRLRRRRIDAVGVESGKAALEIMEAQHFDIVILDVRMPGMDGMQTLKELKRRRPLVEVIILTGYSSVESGIEGMLLGAFDYIMKPASIDDLVARIHEAYERKRLHEQKLREDRLIDLLIDSSE